MAPQAPKVRRVSGGPNKIVYALLGVVGVLIVVVGVLLFGGTIFDQAPQSDLERDYLLLTEALRDNPDSPAILMTLAEVEYELGRRRDAMDRAQRASELSTSTVGISIRYAQLLLRENRLEEAEEYALRETDIVGVSSGHSRFILSQVLRAQGRLDDALEAIAIAVRIDYFAADMKILYGDMLVEAGRQDEAIEQYQEALRYLPNDPRIVEALERLGVEVEVTEDVNPHAPVGGKLEDRISDDPDGIIDDLLEDELWEEAWPDEDSLQP